jgi:NAD(P)-dependent dehydrogenase (short-subunit alcohol dehydrogenase family)
LAATFQPGRLGKVGPRRDAKRFVPVKLKDKVVLITGASKGIGQAIAIGMARQGARVIANYHTDKKGAERTVARIRQAGGRSWAVRGDVSCLPQVHRLFKWVEHQFGRLDVLVNNAAITGWTPLFQTTEEKWDQVLDTNLKGTFFCSLEAARLMKEHGGGSIVNVSTNCAELGVKHLVAYAASKGGIHALTRQLAVELAPYGIRVNTFAPGPTRVERNLRDDPNYDRNWGGVVPLGRTAAPEEMIGPAIFLASDDSSYMTGQVFFVDGGWTVAGKIPEGNLDQAAQRNA